MPKRNKIVATTISNGTCTTHCYSDPAQGPQHIYETVQYNMHDLPTPVILDAAAFGFAAAIGSRLQRNGGFPNVPEVAKELFSEMSAGNWKPSKREAARNKEPSDLAKAIAEVKGMSADLVQHDLDTRPARLNDGSLYKDKAGKPRRYFTVAEKRRLEAEPRIAPILARLSQERSRAAVAAAKAHKPATSLVDTLFVGHTEPGGTEAAN